jgi:hypothetical protein
MSKSTPGTILKRLIPEPVRSAKMINRGTVVTTFTICDNATAAAIELPSTF